MKLIWLKNIFLAISIISLAGCFSSAKREPTTPRLTIEQKPNCGDYSIISDDVVRRALEDHCGINKADEYAAMISAVSRLDPRKEAASAAKRRDFRLAALIHGGPPSPAMYKSGRFWHVAGVKCENLDNSDVAIWLRGTDVISSLNLSKFMSDMRDFSIAYNKALIIQENFPKEKSCK